MLKQGLAALALGTALLAGSVHNADAAERELMFIMDTRQYYENNSVYLAQAPHEIINGVTFVSMRSLSERLGAELTYNPATRAYTLDYLGTTLGYAAGAGHFWIDGDKASFRSGEAHLKNGSLMVPLRETTEALGMRVRHDKGEGKVFLNWQTAPEAPASLELHLPKTTFAMGEPIPYEWRADGFDLDSADVTYTNNERGFFTPGTKTIRAETVVNGQTIRVEEEIEITGEQLYSEAEFERRFSRPGELVDVNGTAVLGMEQVVPRAEAGERVLLRSNNPERVTEPGVYYEDTIDGKARVLVHHENALDVPMRLEAVVKNPSDGELAVTETRIGTAGPTKFPSASGQAAVARFLDSSHMNAVVYAPGAEGIIGWELIEKWIDPGMTATMYLDVETDGEAEVLVRAVTQKEPEAETIVPRAEKHTRGTFAEGDRTLFLQETAGRTPQRVVLGDGGVDPYVTGVDAYTGLSETNFGNRGVHYTLSGTVAEDTGIFVNPRGGIYSGAFLVNGEVVTGSLASSGKALKLYQTGEEEEDVTIEFIPASGSNLPLQLLFQPLSDTSLE
ncbi:copper amine oxidase N-terminal domain-containing protein [Alkalicoccus urumqiensis]|uniref:Copper amine oxidase-like N-terminal domain-containing protein n=1 Tax=Alkalicoccus urumqiensis TaxID=1548213 RepID=A0A2P6MHM2_ALKUR|nr:copper amine oxidase N-terminal domain-containing protein [Alkalicoccus urumqiensis]PRO65750.1 hypothetical protein C6I21_07580 [Alkalicoccus urumqiensis]